MSFGKSKVDRFPLTPKPPKAPARSGIRLAASLPPGSTALASSTPEDRSPSALLSLSRVKQTVLKPNVAGVKRKLTPQRISTTALSLLRSSPVALSKHQRSPTLRLGGLSGNVKSRKSDLLKRKTAQTLDTSKVVVGENSENWDSRNQTTCPSPDIFQTPSSSPRVAEFKDDFQMPSQTTEQEQQNVIETKPNTELRTPNNPCDTNSSFSDALSPPLFESTVVGTKTSEGFEEVFNANDRQDSVTTPGRIPRRRRISRRSIPTPSQLENLNSSNSISTPAPTIRRRIGTQDSPTYRDWSTRVTPDMLSPNRDQEWPSWHLQLPDPTPFPASIAFLDHDMDLDLGKYQMPIILSSSFYNWVMDRLFRRSRNATRASNGWSKLLKPEPVPKFVIDYNNRRLRWWLQREAALFTRYFLEYSVNGLLTGRPYPPTPETKIFAKRLSRLGKRVMKKFQAHVISPAITEVKTLHFWIPHVEFGFGQVVANIFSGIPSIM